MPKAVTGVLVQCDPSIKAILSKINEENGHSFILDDIDDETLLVHSKKLEEFKERLKEALKDTVREAEESNSD